MTNTLGVLNHGTPVLSDERIELLSRTIANGAPPLEFELFVQICNRTGLDPFAKQIYFIQRGGKWAPQTSIDGYRLIAERTGQYAGSDEPVYDSEDGPHPNKATVTVYKMIGGQRCPFTASARWSEYVQDKSPMWGKMPYLMLGKCAESLALRKAFPQELSGLYTREEMDQAGPVDGEYVDAAGVVVDAGTGEIVETPAEDVAVWQPLIDAAESRDELAEIGAAMREAGVTSRTHPELSRSWKARDNRLKIEAAKANRAAQDARESAA